jgi:restriction system protein
LEDFELVFEFGCSIPPKLWIFVLTFAFLLFAIKWDKKRHLLCKWEARQQLKRLGRLNTPQEQITHLRGVNPFVFEEMILTALKQRGYKIKRNKRYSGDGGIDGQVIIKDHSYLIQAKRYANHINPAHVQSFALLCKRRGKRGLFVHTGKTGKKSYQIIQFS